jgi:uncharacterized protein (TIGR00661 family)
MPDAALRVLFFIQGEGRGHLTQALALAPILREAGHSVEAAFVGANPRRDIPQFFRDDIGCPVERYDEPGFGHDKNGKGLSLWATVRQNARRLPDLLTSLGTLDDAIRRYRPDVIVNFYSLMGALHTAFRRHRVPVVAVGHQFMFHHPVYPWPDERALDRIGAKLYTHVVAMGAARKLGLSFWDADALASDPRLRVVPPLLRPGLDARERRDEGFLLVYLLNAGYASDVRSWSEAHPDVPVHVFCEDPDRFESTDSLTFHALSGARFLDHMARCCGLVCTAGFESVCEAMYLGKPALMVPVKGHFEQFCNARDAAQHGAGIRADHFDLDALLALSEHYTPPAAFRAWANQAPAHFVREIEDAAAA